MSGRRFLIYCLIATSVSADLSGILKTCRDVNCDDDPEYNDGSSSLDPEQNFKWISAGLPQIFWQAVRTKSFFNQTVISDACKDQLNSITNGLQRNKRWAYEFVDSSGKTPAGLMRATITALGDYDQCLEIDTAGIRGMFCMIDMHHVKRSLVEDDDLSLKQVNVFAGYPFLSALCLPSACSAGEIKAGLKELLKPYMIKVAGDMNCDTKDNTSWLHLFSNLTTKQIVSLVFISSIVLTVGVCTGIDLYYRFFLEREQESELLKSLSFLSASHKLFFAKPWHSYDVFAFDGMKFGIIFFGTLAHLLVCAEAPLSYATIADHRFLNELMASPATQFLVNDAGLLGVPFLTGIATFSVLFPIAKSRKLPYASAIIDRIARFLPPMLALVACEFIWPIFGNGPLWTRVAEFNLEKCEKNWFYNLLFVNNIFLNSIDICGGHSFYSSVDMQLFLLGLIAVLIFSKSERAGVLFSAAMVAFGTLKVVHSAIKYETAFSLFVVNPVPQKIVEYFFYIHMQTSSYMAAYFTGILLSYSRMNGYLMPKMTSHWTKLGFFAIMNLASNVVNMNAMLRNTYDVYPDHLNWLFISINRIFQLLANAMFYIFAMSLKPHFEKWFAPHHNESGNGNTPSDEQMTFRPFKALCRLCFPLYICNYLYIRSEFFSRRFLAPPGMFWMLKRLSSSIYFVYIFTILFQLMLLAPLDAMREHVMKSKRGAESKRPHAE